MILQSKRRGWSSAQRCVDNLRPPKMFVAVAKLPKKTRLRLFSLAFVSTICYRKLGEIVPYIIESSNWGGAAVKILDLTTNPKGDLLLML
ncbi:unnamed protein product [Brugia pahangi]|uniref:Ovule protein n=1 Tax=Brugia pahangi TaxID=6280 RepID=A0A0N4TMH7_BRUPA|nr:unnamed protein product [Brugia pahangi]